jgi:hypothetical protein
MIFLFGITASTFAWFKINSNASVSGFEFKVQGGEGYQISLDNKTYYTSLTHRQMLQAILHGYDSKYEIIDDEVRYGTTYDDEGNIKSLGSLIPDATVAELVSKIQLLPVTPHEVEQGYVAITDPDAVTINNYNTYYLYNSVSSAYELATVYDESLTYYKFMGNKFSFRNYSGNIIQPSSGQYVEFSIYFKGLGKKEDNQSYGVYVLGEDIKDDITGEAALKTFIKSKEVNEIELKAQMTAIDNSDLSVPYASRTTKLYGPGTLNKKVTVYTANAIRFSIGNENDLSHKDELDFKYSNQIYEISDDQDKDLGSYATNYDTYCSNNGLTIDNLEHNLYDCNSNAQFTYYNNLRSYSPQTPLDYGELQKFNVIRHLTTVEENNNENSQYKDTLHYVTVVKSGEEAHKLTFRFWLEGWDADCFEGISSAIRVNLSFGSVKLS